MLPGQADQQRERLLVRAARLGEEDEVGGVYLGDCKITAVTDPDAADALKHGVHPHAADPSAAARQWEISAALTESTSSPVLTALGRIWLWRTSRDLGLGVSPPV